MSKKSNVHPDYYTGGGRDRPDDAARARLDRAIASKATSQQRPDRMGKDFYFERPDADREPVVEASAAMRAKGKRATVRGGTAGKRAAPKTARPKKAGARKPRTRASGARKPAVARRGKTSRKTAVSRSKKGGTASARPAKKR